MSRHTVPTTPAKEPPTTAASGVIGCFPVRIPDPSTTVPCCLRNQDPSRKTHRHPPRGGIRDRQDSSARDRGPRTARTSLRGASISTRTIEGGNPDYLADRA